MVEAQIMEFIIIRNPPESFMEHTQLVTTFNLSMRNLVVMIGEVLPRYLFTRSGIRSVVEG